MTPILSIQNLVAGYGKLPVLHDVSLDLAQGTMLSVIGPNGAGKTSLTRAIMNQCTVMGGRVLFDGRDITGRPTQEIAAAGLGYVPQTRNVFRSLTVHENLEMSSLLLSAAARRRAIDAAYARFPRLVERRSQHGSSLSGGERQMLAIASALINEPKLIILDEPVSGLSPSMTDEVARGIAEINRGGVGVVWVVEENPQQVIGLSDEVIVMSTGTVRLRETARDLLAADNFRELFLGV
ncbi:MAG: ABC transporter ATP-binding protein [Rhodovulum sulfidophilum]|uniref:ABC transporter ATP-binding protein n=1 Tax=Rhodovulum sulfidophilum TaxID=35806 RepID=A0A2W5N6H0_RHOSU|nr:MAG: ABC transporter ATP-binding protein [Rhodovulum sulfidophilum]